MTTTSFSQSQSASVTFDNSSQCEQGTVELWLDKAFGSFLFVPHLQDACHSCGLPDQQFCTIDGGANLCASTIWGFEPGEPFSWSNSAETFSQISSAQHHTGFESLQVSASSDPTLPASVNNQPCTDAQVGTMDVRGKTYSAWIFVATSTSSYAGTQCRLRAFDRTFHVIGRTCLPRPSDAAAGASAGDGVCLFGATVAAPGGRRYSGSTVTCGTCPVSWET